MTREQLLRSPEYWTTHIQADLYSIIEEYLESNNLKKKDFAEKLGVSKGYISQVLKGDFDHKLSKMVELSLAAGKAVTVKFNDIEKVIEDDRNDKFSMIVEARPIIFQLVGKDGTENVNREEFATTENSFTKVSSTAGHSLVSGSLG